MATTNSDPGDGAKMPSSQVNPVQKESNLGGLLTQEVSPTRLTCLYVGISIGLFLAFLDTSIVATSLFSIGQEFQVLQDLNWVALSYTLTYLGFAVLSAQSSDVVGRRDAFLGFYVVFIAFSIACGLAGNLNQLIAFRALQGLGGSGLYSVGMLCTMELAPPSIQKFLGALIGLIVTMSSVLGPVLGGALTQFASWRWIFWINGPFGMVSMLLAILAWPKGESPSVHNHKRSWCQVDYFGSLLLIAGVVMVVFSFQNASAQPDQWSKEIFLAPLISGLVCIGALFGWSLLVEKRWPDRLIPALSLRVLRNRVYTSALLNTILLGFVYIMIVFAFPLRSQVVNGKTAMIAGVMLLPMLFANALGIGLSGVLNPTGDRPTVPLLVASALIMLGTGLLTTVSSQFELEAKALGFTVFIGLGYGISISTTTVTAANEPAKEDHASAQGLVAQARLLGGSLGIAASSAILGVKLGPGLAQLSPEELASGGSATVGEIQLVRQLSNDAFVQDMQVCTIIAGLALLTGIGSWRKPNVTKKAEAAQQPARDGSGTNTA